MSERVVPFWLTEDFVPGEIYDLNPKEIICFPNGLLHVPTGQFLPPTPKFFTFTCSAFDYDPKAPKPKRWMRFLEEMWPGDNTLMQYIGYMLSGDTSLQKILMIVGPPGSGKSTLLRVMAHVVGQDNVVWTDVESLSDKFGLEALTGKTIAFLPDEVFDYRTCKVGIDRLKRISGEDTVSIRRMREKSLTLRLPVRFVISTNEIPRLRGSAAAMARRFLILRVPEFMGIEDTGLTKTLCEEAPGILNLAIKALKELYDQGFKQPSPEDIEEIRDLGSSVEAFVKDCCVLNGEVETDVLYIHYTGWAESNGEHRIDAREFGRQLRSSVPHVQKAQRHTPQGRTRVYTGISVEP